jgi:hypothetical protein
LKIRKFLVFFLFFAFYPLWAESFGAVSIEPQIPSSVQSFYRASLMAYLSEGGEQQAAFFDNIIKGTAVSGLLYQADDGRYFAVTSYYATVLSSEATVTVRLAGGKVTAFRACPIVYRDAASGLALVALPAADYRIDYAAQPAAPSVGDVLLAEKLSGSEAVLLTNIRTALSFLGRSRYFMSVSSEPDYAWSGTPLFTESNEENIRNFAGLALYFPGTDAYVSLAVPGAAVMRFLSAYAGQGAEDVSEAALEQKAITFAQSVAGSRINETAALFSPELSRQYGVKALEDIFKNRGSSAVKETFIKEVRAGNLYNLPGRALAALLRADNNLSYRSILVFNAAQNSDSTVAFYLDGQIVTTHWQYSEGAWLLHDIDNLLLQGNGITENAARSNNAAPRGRYSGLYFGAGGITGKNFLSYADIGFDFAPVKFISLGFGLSYSKMEYKAENGAYNTELLTPTFSLRLQYPIRFGRVMTLMPYAGAFVGLPVLVNNNLAETEPYSSLLLAKQRISFMAGWFAGAEMGFGPEPRLFIGGKFGYQQDVLSERLLQNEGGGAHNFYFNIYMKIALF